MSVNKKRRNSWMIDLGLIKRRASNNPSSRAQQRKISLIKKYQNQNQAIQSRSNKNLISYNKAKILRDSINLAENQINQPKVKRLSGFDQLKNNSIPDSSLHFDNNNFNFMKSHNLLEEDLILTFPQVSYPIQSVASFQSLQISTRDLLMKTFGKFRDSIADQQNKDVFLQMKKQIQKRKQLQNPKKYNFFQQISSKFIDKLDKERQYDQKSRSSRKRYQSQFHTRDNSFQRQYTHKKWKNFDSFRTKSTHLLYRDQKIRCKDIVKSSSQLCNQKILKQSLTLFSSFSKKFTKNCENKVKKIKLNCKLY